MRTLVFEYRKNVYKFDPKMFEVKRNYVPARPGKHNPKRKK
jgi:hypothetical protein